MYVRYIDKEQQYGVLKAGMTSLGKLRGSAGAINVHVLKDRDFSSS